MRRKNVFLVGADRFNQKQLQRARWAGDLDFHSLLTFEEVKGGGRYPAFDELLGRAEQQLIDHGGPIDAITGYWDFPVNSLVPVLCERHELPSPTCEAETCCDHKYWSRLEQRAVIPEHTPAFAAVDPFAEEPLADLPLEPPFWIKPVKGTDSLLAFRIDGPEDFERALPRIREGIPWIARSFDQLLAHADLPEEVRPVTGSWCIAEECIEGQQCTIEGHVYAGKVHVHGLIDSINYPDSSSFLRYQYPSRLPDRVKEAMSEASRRLMEHIGFDNGAFNIEFFYDEDGEDFRVLEVNPRISQSHSDMFEKVDGASNHKIAIDLALGREPDFPKGKGEFGAAAKFHLRRFRDGRVERAPDEEEIAELEERFPGVELDVIVKPGMVLHDLIEQDSYSYDMAHIYVGGADEAELLERYERVVEALPLEVVDLED